MGDIVKLLMDMHDSTKNTKTRSPNEGMKTTDARMLVRYLLKEVQADRDKKDPERDHRAAWEKLKPLMLLPALRPFLHNKFAYKVLLDQFEPEPPKTNQPLYNPTRFPNWEASHFFQHLQIQASNETRIMDRDRFYLMLCFRLLELAARVPALYRKPDFERKVWRYAHAHAKALGYLKEFESETAIKKKVENFLKSP